MLAVSRFVLRHRLAVLVAGGAASAKLSSRLSGQFALPGTASYQANQQILRLYVGSALALVPLLMAAVAIRLLPGHLGPDRDHQRARAADTRPGSHVREMELVDASLARRLLRVPAPPAPLDAAAAPAANLR